MTLHTRAGRRLILSSARSVGSVDPSAVKSASTREERTRYADPGNMDPDLARAVRTAPCER
jgi:hypothetical protein